MSGRKNTLSAASIINAGNMSASSITSLVTDIRYMDDIGIQFSWTSSPVGTFAVQVSADYKQDELGNVLVAGNWIPVTITYWNGSAFVTGTTVSTSVGSPIYLDLALLSAPYIRSVYTKISGSGTLTGTICGKMV